MPPKAPPPKKLTKKELKEKMLEEQRQREEQERIRKEEEEKKRQEEERLRKLEEERLAAEEKARLHEEEIENEVQKAVFRENLENAKKIARSNDDWDKFLLCSTLPDISLESQLTTFITTFKEQKPLSDLKVLEELQRLQYAENVVRDISRFITQLKAERQLSGKQNEKNEVINRYKGYILQIRQVMARKVEEINTQMVINAELMIEEKMAESNKKINEGPNKTFKLDDKNKQEVIKTFPPVDDVKFGIFIYPINRPSGYRHKPNDFAELQIQADIPRQIQMFVQKILWVSYDNYSPESYSKYRIVGGVLDIEYLQMLPAPKKVSNWTLKQNYDTGEVVKRNTFDLNAPLKIAYALPPYVWIPSKENQKAWRVAVFDKLNDNWVLDGVEDAKLDKDIFIAAAVPRLGPVGLLQERCLDYPYRSFKLRCVAPDRAILDIEGKRDLFKFEIGPGYVQLLKKDPEFQSYAFKKLQVGALFYELYRSGVNMIPTPEDAQSANIVAKNEQAEELALSDLGEAVRGFFIQSSRWNNSATGECIVARIKENNEYDEEFAENQEKDWKMIKWWNNKCAAIQAKDSQPVCKQDLLPDTETHCSLEVLLKLNQLTPQEIMAKIKDLHYVIFIETVQQVLRLTKLLSFTVLD